MAFDVDEKYFELLLSEKNLADKMVSGYADLSLKVFGMFGAGGALLGWLFSANARDSWSTSIGVACIALAIASCGIVAQGVNTYSLTLGYVQYRNEYLNDAFRRLLVRPGQTISPDHPIQAVDRWLAGAARQPTTFANGLIAALHAGACMALLIMASYCFKPTVWPILALALSWCALLATAFTEIELLEAMKRVFHASEDRKSKSD
jgi:hypothetical protein